MHEWNLDFEMDLIEPVLDILIRSNERPRAFHPG